LMNFVLVCLIQPNETFLSNCVTLSLSYHTHIHSFNSLLSRTTRVSQYQKGKTNLDFTEATDSEWLWHQLDHMQVCTSLQPDNHASTSPLSFLQARYPFSCSTNSIKALKAHEGSISYQSKNTFL